MSQLGSLRWWHWGLAGGILLVFISAQKLVTALVEVPVPWREIAVIPPAMFAIGFVCGSVAGWLRSLSYWLGWFGDGIIGAVVGFLFFGSCAFFFSREGSFILLALVGSVIGFVGGIYIGWDWRRE